MTYDVIIVGSGAGGGIAAHVLARAGKRVLLLERGRRYTFADEPRDHLRNHRLSRYGHNTGPELEGNPRVLVHPNGRQTIERPHQAWMNIASGVGSGTQVYGGQAWRFHPLDFQMATTYGVPEGSSNVDWPIGYEDLAPYYEAVEWEVGVNGSPPPPQMPPRRDYPMRPVPLPRTGELLWDAAYRKGWDTQRVPLLINSVERDGRSGCVGCQHCVGFLCPVDARNGTHNTVIPRALASGLCELQTDTFVTRVLTEGGRAVGVSALHQGQAVEYRAEVVILSAGAIETARLLLNSGLGNARDQVGRNLQGHYYANAFGFTDEPIWDGLGPGASIATLQFSHGNPGVLSGGMLADDFVMLPIVFAKSCRPPTVPAWGAAHKDFMRRAYRRMLRVCGPVHEIPSADCRVQLDPEVRDRYGLPVARLSGKAHPETVRTTEYMNERAKEWLTAAGAKDVFAWPVTAWLSGGQHQAGTCRMGEDPSASVTDPEGRVHGHQNLLVCDGSVHPTNGGFNPVLTIMATAYRTADRLAKRW